MILYVTLWRRVVGVCVWLFTLGRIALYYSTIYIIENLTVSHGY